MSRTLRELPLATSTVSGDFFHLSGADLLDKRITIDDIATAVRETFKGKLLADDNIEIGGSGLLKARPNTDTVHEIARLKLFGISDVGYISHFDKATTSNYGVGFSSAGDLFLNAGTGKTVSIRNNNGEIINISGTSVNIKKPLNITGKLTVSNGIDITGGVLNVRPNTDTTHTLGRTKIHGASDNVYIGHYDKGTSGAGFIQTGTNGTYLNTVTGGSLYLTENISNKLATFSSSAISLLKPVTISANNARSLYLEHNANMGDYSEIAFGTVGYSGAKILSRRTNVNYFGNEGNLEFYTQTGSNHENASILQMELNQYGHLLLGTTTDAGYKLDVNGTARTGALTCSTINTGQGANELYGMNQSVKTTDSVTFAGATINGHINPTTTTQIGSEVLVTSTGQIVCSGVKTDNVAVAMKKFTIWADSSGGLSFNHGLNHNSFLGAIVTSDSPTNGDIHRDGMTWHMLDSIFEGEGYVPSRAVTILIFYYIAG